MSIFFLNHLRHLLSRCEKYGKQVLQTWEIEDLLLWIDLLACTSSAGISTNNLCFTTATTILVTDACEHGIGGFNVHTGQAWRYSIPEWMSRCWHINALEFLASIVAIWIEIINGGEAIKESKFLSLTDNSSTVSWLLKGNFHPKTHQHHDILARKLARLLLKSETSISTQHIKGEHNMIADALSRDHHVEDTHLIFALSSLYPSQAPKNFRLYKTLTREITSLVELLKAVTTSSEATTPPHSKSKMGALIASSDSWDAVASTIHSLVTSVNRNEPPSSPLMRPVFDEMKMAAAQKPISRAAQLPPPSTTYVRPFGRTFGATRL